jgi:antitoxin (DNA-binding transcriptional repressor) of toxin-antitoxin stability system
LGVKLVTVEQLAYHLRDYIAEVQEGSTIHIFQDGKAIATINPAVQPFELEMPPPGKRPCDFVPTPLSKPLDKDPAEVIIEERERERSGAKYK